MDIIKQVINEQPVDLILSFESCMKVERALEVVIAQIKMKMDEFKPKPKEELPSRVYLNSLIYDKLSSEVEILTDLQRAITMRMDNVADNFGQANKPSLDELTELDRKDANGFTQQKLAYLQGASGITTNL